MIRHPFSVQRQNVASHSVGGWGGSEENRIGTINSDEYRKRFIDKE